MVCGFIEFADFLFAPIFRSLPTVLVDRTGDDRASTIITATVKEILTLADAAVQGTDLMLGRLMEMLFLEVLRRYATRLPVDARGWFSAVKDPLLRRAMHCVHADPARRWTVDALARAAGTSRTVLAERLKAVLGQTPIAYVTSWRIQLAADRLRNSSGNLAVIAADVGYESEAAFNRAFKRVTGITPGRWREGAVSIDRGSPSQKRGVSKRPGAAVDQRNSAFSSSSLKSLSRKKRNWGWRPPQPW